jgi:hypothetical protein
MIQRNVWESVETVEEDGLSVDVQSRHTPSLTCVEIGKQIVYSKWDS